MAKKGEPMATLNCMMEKNAEKPANCDVGMTRAMRSLTLCHAARRTRHGEVVECEPSRFLFEIPADLVEWEGREPERTPEERRERGHAAIAGLRQLLSD